MSRVILAKTDLQDLNEQALYWVNHVANVRVHGTTQERPIDLIAKERLNLVSEPFEYVEFHTRKVSSDTIVSYEGNRYSVPIRFVRHLVKLKDDRRGGTCIYHDGELIAEHRKSSEHMEVVQNKNHFEGIRNDSVAKPVPQPSPYP